MTRNRAGKAVLQRRLFYSMAERRGDIKDPILWPDYRDTRRKRKGRCRRPSELKRALPWHYGRFQTLPPGFFPRSAPPPTVEGLFCLKSCVFWCFEPGSIRSNSESVPQANGEQWERERSATVTDYLVAPSPPFDTLTACGPSPSVRPFDRLTAHGEQRKRDRTRTVADGSRSCGFLKMPSNKGCTLAAHLVVVSADPNQVSAGVQFAELGARDAVHGPFGVSDRHDCIGPIMQNERRTFYGIGREPRLARPIGPVILNPLRPLATADH